MKSEMDILSMDERQRVCWLLANRATLMIVGLVWLGMIVWKLIENRIPYFLIIMVPVFGLIRFAMYHVYSAKLK
ncbi:MAG: hypothetical protein GWO41_16420 [candidate division Zixibacteria bacterium]|nr:hypothetical protein [candidate division Zixibacteria bacterium]NIR66374.1 hypothetical protein [candidate division Zixibacteria bacterium]NIS17995.1 hypothetical protein [candidate division Zixibacteria bacterium]NIS47976.1 hypothetical protein [candidate division Zixibacteria bacterium]NIT54278.1 hypothetical protein [candidate division Zixibacteria bacterium]